MRAPTSSEHLQLEHIRDTAAADVLQSASARLKEARQRVRALDFQIRTHGTLAVGTRKIELAQMEYETAKSEFDAAEAKFAMRAEQTYEQRLADRTAQTTPRGEINLSTREKARRAGGAK